MSAISTEDIGGFLREYLLQKLKAQGRDLPADYGDDCDLLLTGLIDSLGILELTVAINDYCGFEIDFEALDPEQMTIVGPLCRFVSLQTSER